MISIFPLIPFFDLPASLQFLRAGEVEIEKFVVLENND